ncbi:MAG: response regulator [Alphaproteobacteria bacterium]
MVAFDGREVKVLIAEDNPQFRLLVRTVLRSLGIRDIVEAEDGADALERLRTFPADLVIVDWKMAPMNGLDFVRTLRNAAGPPDPLTPVIMITGYADAGMMAAARDAGVNEFIAKPISARMLMSRVFGVLQRPRPFVRADGFFGPDRRRKTASSPPLPGEERRTRQTGLITTDSETTLVE